MHPEQLPENYPRLYHMAWEGSWESIEKYGLLSTERLVALYGLDEEGSAKIRCTHRQHWVEIEGNGLPKAVIRDQKPMSDASLRKALGGKLGVEEWYSLLNSMVFFWPTKRRLRTMMSARAYVGMKHDLIILNTARLVEAKLDQMLISPMNSGCTIPWAHPRDKDLFKSVADYPFDERRKSRGIAGALAEVCIKGGLEEAAAFVDEVHTVQLDDIDKVIP